MNKDTIRTASFLQTESANSEQEIQAALQDQAIASD